MFSYLLAYSTILLMDKTSLFSRATGTSLKTAKVVLQKLSLLLKVEVRDSYVLEMLKNNY